MPLSRIAQLCPAHKDCIVHGQSRAMVQVSMVMKLIVSVSGAAGAGGEARLR